MRADEVAADARLVVVKGRDPVLVNEAVLTVQSRLVGGDDPTLVLDVIGPERIAPADADPDLAPLIDAAQTMPFLTDRRVVVGRGLGRFGKKDDVAGLVDYLADPLPSTTLVLVWEKPADVQQLAAMPKALTEAVRAAGGVVVDTDPPQGKKHDWVADQLKGVPLRLDRSAVALVVDHIGDDAARFPGIVQALLGAYGEGASLSADDVAPFLLEAGGVAPWDLTDAIDRGDVTTALAVLERMLHGGGRHPLQVLATLHNHYQRMLALDGAGARTKEEAAAVLGEKPSFPIQKALEQSRRLGPERIAEFIALLAQADLDLKGGRHFGWDGGGEAVTEVLVARLASRSPRGAAGGGRPGGHRR